jgi:hypothetical protein
MPNPANLDDFVRFDALLEAALEEATKEEVAACARLLGLNVAYYKGKYGEVPFEEHRKLMETESIDESMAKLLAQGMLEMLMALAEATGKEDEVQKYKAMSVGH